jgi:hypothetical protein
MTIKALDALQKGYQCSINARIGVGIVYAAGLLLVLPFAYALRAILAAAAGASMEHGVLLSGFDFSMIFDLARVQRGALGALYDAAAGAGLAYLAVTVFLSGGILVTVRQDGLAVTAADFFAGAATYCGRFFRLAAIVYGAGVLVAIPLLLAAFALLGLWEAGAQTEIPETIVLGLRLLCLLFVLVPVTMVFDYARIDTVMTDGTAMRRSAWRGLRFVYRRFGRAIKLQLILLLLLVLLAAVYLALVELVGTSSTPALIATVFLQQLFIVQRIGLRILGFAAESALYRELNPEGGGIPGWYAGHSWE